MIYLLLFLSIIIGLIFAFLIKNRNLNIDNILSFSSSYLLGIVFNHFLPEIYNKENQKGIGFFILGGILFQIFLKTITSGIEHGHIHSKKKSHFSYGIFLGLFIHSLLESLSLNKNQYNLLFAIIIHKIPVSSILYFFLTDTIKNKKKVFFLMGIFSFSAPLGVLIGKFLIFTKYGNYVNAFISGIFIHISTVIWFENSDNRQTSLKKLLIFLLGIVLSYLFL